MRACVCVYVCVWVCVCVCVHMPRPTNGMILTLKDGWIIVAAFQFNFMVLVVNVIDSRGPSNEIRHQLQLKIKVTLY